MLCIDVLNFESSSSSLTNVTSLKYSWILNDWQTSNITWGPKNNFSPPYHHFSHHQSMFSQFQVGKTLKHWTSGGWCKWYHWGRKWW